MKCRNVIGFFSDTTKKFVMTNSFSLQMGRRLLFESYAIVLSYVLNLQHSLFCKEDEKETIWFNSHFVRWLLELLLRYSMYHFPKLAKLVAFFIILLNRFLLCNVMKEKKCTFYRPITRRENQCMQLNNYVKLSISTLSSIYDIVWIQLCMR